MGFLSVFRKKDREDDGETQFRGGASAGGGATRSRGRTGSRTGNAAADPILPEKKRARRRLIGAAALLLVLIVVLPYVFDSRPAAPAGEIAIDIPGSQSGSADAASADNSASSQAAASTTSAPNEPASALADASPTVPDSAAAAATDAPAAQPGTGESEQRTPTAPSFRLSQQHADAAQSSEPEVVAPKAAVNREVTKSEVAAAREEKPKPVAVKPEAHPAPATVPHDDSARALAILEGRPAASTQAATEAPAKPAVKPADKASSEKRKVAVQVAAVSSETSANELVAKLKAAGVSAYTQKSGSIIRVRVGPFNTRAEAEQMKAKLAGLGMPAALAD